MPELVKLKEKAKNFSALIVEDSLTIQKQMKIFLEKLFGTVYIANNGLEGLEITLRVKPDIILSDLQMPKMDGHEFIEKINEKNIKTQIIIFSAYGHAENMTKYLRMGVCDFLQKPVNFKELTKSLIKAVNNIEGKELSSDKKFDNEILKDLNIIKESKGTVQLINHYKGLPLIHDGFISAVTNEAISIKAQKIQIKASLIQHQTVIETDKYIINAKLLGYDRKNNELIFNKLEEIERSPKEREVLRVEPSDGFNATVYTSSERYSLEVISVSTKSVSLETKNFDFNLSINESANIILGFSTFYSSTFNNTITRKEKVDCKGKVFKIIELDENKHKIVFLIDLTPSDKKTLERYIYQREVEIIKEFKNLSVSI